MPEKREAKPGAFKLPAGAKNKEEIEEIKATLRNLQQQVDDILSGKTLKKKA